MRTRSYIFVLVLLALGVAAGVALIQRSKSALAEPLASAMEQPEGTPTAEPEERNNSTAAAQAGNSVSEHTETEGQEEIPCIPVRAARVQGVEGLALQMSRPLMFDVGPVYGFAADDEYLYVGSWGASKHSIAIYQARRTDLTYAQMRVLPQDVNCYLGGLDVGNEYLVGTLLREGESGTALLFIDRKMLQVVKLVEIPVRVGPVAQGPDGTIYAYGLDDNTGYVLDAEGMILQETLKGAETTYHGLDIANGRLICAGWDEGEGLDVIDVVEPGDFSIVTRHRVYLKPASCDSLTSAGLAMHQDTFFFVAGAGPRPMVMSFGLDDVTLSEFIP